MKTITLVRALPAWIMWLAFAALFGAGYLIGAMQ